MKASTDRPRFLKLQPALLALIAVCAVVELVLQGADWQLWGQPQWRALAYQNAGFWNGLLSDWRPNYVVQPYLMFITYGFLHAGFTHLVVNMFTLSGLGTLVIDRIGPGRFLLLYLWSIAGGAFGFAALGHSVQPMVGASGALFGLAGALVAWDYLDRYDADEQLWPVLRLIVFLFLLNLIMWWAMNGRLAWETHLGGFLAGWIFALVLVGSGARSNKEDP